jgi:hypothetical protein
MTRVRPLQHVIKLSDRQLVCTLIHTVCPSNLKHPDVYHQIRTTRAMIQYIAKIRHDVFCNSADDRQNTTQHHQ